jgi:hypothetical protein
MQLFAEGQTCSLADIFRQTWRSGATNELFGLDSSRETSPQKDK